MANEAPHQPGLLSLGVPSQNVDCVNLLSMILLSLEEGLSPSVEELSPDLPVDVESDQILVLVVLMHEIHGISVPSPEPVPLPLHHIALHGLDKLINSLLQVLHLGRAVSDLLQGVLGSHVEGLSQHLEQEFGGEQPNMRFVGLNDVGPLSVHGGHIVLVPCVELVHLPHQIVSLVRDHSQVILESPFLALGSKGPLPHVIQLVVELPESSAVRVMFHFKFSELVVLVQELGVNFTSFAGNAFSRSFLLSETAKHAVLFNLKAIQLSPELVVQLALIPQILLQVAVDDILDAAHLIQLPFQIVRKHLLPSQLVLDVVLLLSGSLQLGKDEVESFHETSLVLLQHHDLFLVLLVGLVELTTSLQVRSSLFNRAYSISETVRLFVKSIVS